MDEDNLGRCRDGSTRHWAERLEPFATLVELMTYMLLLAVTFLLALELDKNPIRQRAELTEVALDLPQLLDSEKPLVLFHPWAVLMFRCLRDLA